MMSSLDEARPFLINWATEGIVLDILITSLGLSVEAKGYIEEPFEGQVLSIHGIHGIESNFSLLVILAQHVKAVFFTTPDDEKFEANKVYAYEQGLECCWTFDTGAAR